MSRENRYLNENESGAIGIGAMIIFIALILVAAVASTIIIKTAEELQQRAEATGDDTRDEISGKIQLVGAYVSDDNAAGNAADEITLIVQLSAGSDTTLLANMDWFIVCDGGAGTADVNTADFDGVATDLDGTLLVAGSSVQAGETFLVPIDTSTNCQPGVGDEQELRVIIDGGGETYAQLHYNSVDNGDTIV
jgi:flagellin FlaB